MPTNIPEKYPFQCPFATAIHPLITNPDVTLSLLREINISMPITKRLPEELLLHVNEELHSENVVWNGIRDTWSPVVDFKRDDFSYGHAPLDAALFNFETKRYYIPDKPFRLPSPVPGVGAVSCSVSSADFLYRLRCFFPEINICTVGIDWYKAIWAAILEHNLTGLSLLFTESSAGAQLWSGYNTYDSILSGGDEGDDEEKECRDSLLEEFSMDSILLLNTLFETFGENSSGQFAYYHPAAIGDLKPINQHFIAVPDEPLIDSISEDIDQHEPYRKIYKKWYLVEVPEIDVSAWFSLLQDLKYDINSRKIDRIKGGNLTSVISSALLFYRLLCKYGGSFQPDIYRNVAQLEAPTITSVWEVQLRHRETDLRLMFMDDHGLFDIRADSDATKVIEDIEELVEYLCSDFCMHPYNVLAGSEA